MFLAIYCDSKFLVSVVEVMMVKVVKFMPEATVKN